MLGEGDVMDEAVIDDLDKIADTGESSITATIELIASKIQALRVAAKSVPTVI